MTLFNSYQEETKKEYNEFIKLYFPMSKLSNSHNKLIEILFESIEVTDIYCDIYRGSEKKDFLNHIKHQLFLVAYILPNFNDFVFSGTQRNLVETIFRLSLVMLDYEKEDVLKMNYRQLNQTIKKTTLYKNERDFRELIGVFFSYYGQGSGHLHRSDSQSSPIQYLKELSREITHKENESIIKFFRKYNDLILGPLSKVNNINDSSIELHNKINLKNTITREKYNVFFAYSE